MEDMTLIGAMTLLADLGFDRVAISYSGGGDSGAIDNIYFLFPGEEDDAYFEQEEKENRNSKISKGIIDHIDKLVDKILLEDIEDWYNNDGGFGLMIIEIPSGKYKIANTLYYTNTQTYFHEGNFNPED